MKRLAFALICAFANLLLNAQNTKWPATPRKVILTDSVSCTSVKDQSQSPTCWVFGTNSLIESDLLKKYNTRLNLSEIFIAGYAYINKAKQFLATKGKTYFEGGGQFHDVIRVINNYGIVPEEVYDRKPGKQLNHNHSALDTAMKLFTYALLKEGKMELDTANLQQINDTLDKYLGKFPVNFFFKEKEYTPVSFAQEIVRFDYDYVELVSFADQPYYKKFILADKYNWASDSFYNIILEDMHLLVDTALHKGSSVSWEGDVTEKEFHYAGGYASFADAAHFYDEERIQNYRDKTTERDHMLHITAEGRDETNKKWYYLKNSWGTYFSKFDGNLFMKENYSD